jgi:hypothetical protein
MTQFCCYQETDSQIVSVFPAIEGTAPYSVGPGMEIAMSHRGAGLSAHGYQPFYRLGYGNETVSEAFGVPIDLLPAAAGLVKPAREAVRCTPDPEVAERASGILSAIQETLVSLHQLGLDLSHLPLLHAFNVEDGSVLIEWIFASYRIGWSVEPDPRESSWYLVSNKDLGEISASGYLSSIDARRLILWLINFALTNS